MKITDFGKELRKLRIDHNERLAHMAQRLGVSASFISAIETGKKSPPADFDQAVSRSYGLSTVEANRLASTADASRVAFMITPQSPLGRDTAGLMARRINGLSPEALQSIRNILLQSQGDKK